MATRIASVVVLLPLIIAAVWWPPTTALLAGLAIALAIGELFAIFRHGGYAPRTVEGITIGLAICAATFFQPLTTIDLMLVVIFGSIIGALIVEIARHERQTSLLSWALTFAGAYYVGGLLSSYLLLRQLDMPLQNGWLAFAGIPPGAAWVFFTLAITWLQDTGAFFVGRKLGRTKMAPILSPKKSWEGFFGGMAAAIATALFCVPLLGLPITLWQAAILGVVAGIFGPLGDLAESLIKRQVGVKDSGFIIPGHGGILDRIDSILFTGPVVYYFIVLFTR
ncbi:phosphatidate cytidylyltransferase [Chloroflexus aggregans]|uniref:Phosphatidate cytidylyltransferase n=1 Tax=Chloroflexus aggregans (strain MD-66 / DSM 9485) TaxID=326427 RepID=B8G463_CHLAD|nr:phosphatidate cytidylyltransferase [Chloroflexus aggregans]ACL23469.1 phosphatidate cytidylyltransferase [Chloroflexus aggregans DSM 9485]